MPSSSLTCKASSAICAARLPLSISHRCPSPCRRPAVSSLHRDSVMTEPVGRLVLLRHGQSTWNLENLFTGWVDVDLTDQGREEAREAGRLLKSEGIAFDIAFVSVLKRAIRTLWIALDELDLMWLP